eukprot:6211840-Pleurochrysis_carterae.AAC.5
MRPNARLSTCTLGPRISHPSRSSMCATSLARPTPWLFVQSWPLSGTLRPLFTPRYAKRLEVPPDVATFLGSFVPEHGVFNFDLLPLAGDVETPCGRRTHLLRLLLPVAPCSASFCAVASDLYHLAPEQTRLAPSVPTRAVRNVAPLPLPSALAYGLQPIPSHRHLACTITCLSSPSAMSLQPLHTCTSSSMVALRRSTRWEIIPARSK